MKQRAIFGWVVGGCTLLALLLDTAAVYSAWDSEDDVVLVVGVTACVMMFLSILIWVPGVSKAMNCVFDRCSVNDVSRDMKAGNAIASLFFVAYFSGTMHTDIDDVTNKPERALAFAASVLYLVVAILAHSMGRRMKKEKEKQNKVNQTSI